VFISLHSQSSFVLQYATQLYDCLRRLESMQLTVEILNVCFFGHLQNVIHERIKQSSPSCVLRACSMIDIFCNVYSIQETQIGRQVNRLRKHNSKEIQSMVKRLIRYFKPMLEAWIT
jgi:hypothetical protein